MRNENWQITLFKRSLMKKEKVRLISKIIDFKNKKILDAGCSYGVVSYFLKKNGGKWFHCDLDFENIKNAKSILKDNLFQTSDKYFPLKNNNFDMVLLLDILEHVDDDKRLVKNAYKVLKKNGRLVISTPISGKFFILNKIKYLFGLKPEIYGHKREGYSLKELKNILIDSGFKVDFSSTYSKFLIEFFEILLNIIFSKMNKNKVGKLRTGAISPSNEKDLKKNKFLFYIYSYLVYPIIYLITRLDKFLFFKTGYATLVIATKE